jgi:hypothetical protein
MARGWESKSVESQQSEEPLEQKVRISRESLERNAKRDSLTMSRHRIERELENTRSEVHRTALKNALEYLDSQLSRL